MANKIILTFVFLAIYWAAQGLFNPVATLVSGAASVDQLRPSDLGYLHAYGTARVLHALSWLMLVSVAGMLWAVWHSDIKRLVSALKEEWAHFTGMIIVIGFLLAAGPAHAYYSKTNYTEMMVILPNQTAFMVPVAGDNATGQAKFGSADYFNSKKVATKRVEIPHVQLQGSSWYANYWVPAANVILVNRIAYYREWTADPTTGTSAKNQAVRCESADSIGVTVAVTISAEIEEEDAAAYLYRFGVIPPFDSAHLQPDQMSDSQGAALFASVFYAKDLDTVMDTVVHGAVKTSMCNEMAKLKLEDLFANKATMIGNVNTGVATMYKPDGITIRYIGYASDLQYDHKIQESIDNVFIARRQNDSSVALRESLPVLQQQADMRIKDGLATALSTKGLPPITLPNFLFLPSGVFDWFSGWFAPTPAKTSAK